MANEQNTGKKISELTQYNSGFANAVNKNASFPIEVGASGNFKMKLEEIKSFVNDMLDAELSKKAGVSDLNALSAALGVIRTEIENLELGEGGIGPQGPKGENGKSIVAITAAMTNATFLTLGIGDLIVNTSSSAVNIGHTSSANTSAAAGAVYEKTASNAVTARGNILGPQGPAGGGGLSGATNLGNVDMNTVTTTGFYRVGGGSQSASHYPANSTTAWNLAVFAGGNGVMQFASYYGGSTASSKWRIWWRVGHTDSSAAGTPGTISWESSSAPYGWNEIGSSSDNYVSQTGDTMTGNLTMSNAVVKLSGTSNLVFTDGTTENVTPNAVVTWVNNNSANGLTHTSIANFAESLFPTQTVTPVGSSWKAALNPVTITDMNGNDTTSDAVTYGTYNLSIPRTTKILKFNAFDIGDNSWGTISSATETSYSGIRKGDTINKRANNNLSIRLKSINHVNPYPLFIFNMGTMNTAVNFAYPAQFNFHDHKGYGVGYMRPLGSVMALFIGNRYGDYTFFTSCPSYRYNNGVDV